MYDLARCGAMRFNTSLFIGPLRPPARQRIFFVYFYFFVLFSWGGFVFVRLIDRFLFVFCSIFRSFFVFCSIVTFLGNIMVFLLFLIIRFCSFCNSFIYLCFICFISFVCCFSLAVCRVRWRSPYAASRGRRLCPRPTRASSSWMYRTTTGSPCCDTSSFRPSTTQPPST